MFIPPPLPIITAHHRNYDDNGEYPTSKWDFFYFLFVLFIGVALIFTLIAVFKTMLDWFFCSPGCTLLSVVMQKIDFIRNMRLY